MHAPDLDAVFAGSIPQIYERYLVPLIFEPYAADLAARTALRQPARMLEIAAGTGVATRQLAKVLPPDVSIVATDLNQPMLDQAAAQGTARPVVWRQADAMDLPFPNQYFDVVICQFGVMFFPDKPKAFAEAKRVLRSNGQFIFTVWDRIEHNAFADAVTQALGAHFPNDPPRFLARIAHGYHDLAAIAQDLACGGFTRPPAATTQPARSRAESPRIPAIAYCQGTPLRNEIEARDPAGLLAATNIAANAVMRQFGSGAVDGEIQAHIISIEP